MIDPHQPTDKPMEDITRIERVEGFVGDPNAESMNRDDGTFFCLRKDVLLPYAATLFISKDATPPKVFTDPSELWISVSDERKPEQHVKLHLCLIDAFGMRYVSEGYYDPEKNISDEGWYSHSTSGPFAEGWKVTHWQPLISPPNDK